MGKINKDKPGDILFSCNFRHVCWFIILLKLAFDKIAMVNFIMLNINFTHFIFSLEDYLCL